MGTQGRSASVGQLVRLRPIVNRPTGAFAADSGGKQPPRRLPACPTAFRRILFLCACLSIAVAAQTAAQLKQQAEVLKARGDAAGALALIGRAAAANPKSAELEDETGFLLAVLNRSPEAKPHFERAIELEPGFAPAQFHLGVLYCLPKRPNHAIPLLQAACRLAPSVSDYHLKLGLSFFEVGHFEESVSELKIAT